MEQSKTEIERIWEQYIIPVVYRRKSPPLLVKLPISENIEDRLSWLRDNRHHIPKWSDEYHCWETPVAWFDTVIRQILDHYGEVYVIELYKEKQTCAARCWNAEGFHCECSCLGENHGSRNPSNKYFKVTDTFAVHWGTEKYACRYFKVKEPDIGDHWY